MPAVTPYLFVTVACAGFAAFAALHHFHIWWLSRRERTSALFAAFCAAGALLATALVAAATATTIEAGQAALDARTTFGIIQHGILLWLIAAVTGLWARWFMGPVTLVLTTGVLSNLLVFPIAGTVMAVGQLQLPWGEVIADLTRQRQWVGFAVVVYTSILAVQVYALVGAVRLWQRDRLAGVLMAAAGSAGIAGVVLGLLVDLTVFRAPYIGQVPGTIWVVLLAVLLSREYAHRGRQVQAGEQRFRAVLDQTFQFIGVMSVDGRLLQANRAALQFAGLQEDQVVGRFFWDTPWWAHSPELQARLRDAVRRAAGGEATRFEASHPSPDGRLAYVDFSLKPVFDDRGTVTMLIPEGHDITERKLAAQSLAISEARYRTLIESAPEAIVVFDLGEGRFAEFNAQALRLFGTSADELRTKNVTDLSPPVQPDGQGSRAAAEGFIRQAVEGGTPVFEWTHCTVEGTEIPCEVRLIRLPDPSRILVRGSITDISGRLKLEEQLRQSQKMQAIGQLAGGVAHDFNNLLTVISGYSEILRKHLPESDPGSAYVAAIQDASSRAAWLTDRLLAFSRRSVLAPKVIDLNVVVHDAEGMLRRVIGEDVRLQVDLHAGASPVMIDSGQWSQVILNLAINARDAMPRGGRLTIATAIVEADDPFAGHQPGPGPGRYARVTVSDTGCGMSPEVIARMFEPFFTTKEMGKGTGLGLAVVHGIVTQAGGAIGVASEVGAGTTVTISLPAAAEMPAAPAAAAGEPGAGAGETILLVEDEANVRELVEFSLVSQGFRVLSAATGEEALQRMAAHGDGVDLLVTDVVMPGGMSGHQLGETLRARYPGLRTLYISGYIADANRDARGSGAGEEFLQKPFALSDLSRKVRDLLDRPRSLVPDS